MAKLELEMPEKTKKRILNLVKLANLPSEKELITRALATYEILIQKKGEGFKIYDSKFDANMGDIDYEIILDPNVKIGNEQRS